MYGNSLATSGNTRGVLASSSSPFGVGVEGSGATGNFGYLGTPQQGVYGENATSGAKGSLGSADYGVYGNDFDGSHAGYFNGDVQVNGNLTKSVVPSRSTTPSIPNTSTSPPASWKAQT